MLLAFDLDNTIVTREHTLPEEIIFTLNRVRAEGHHITVLTGRPPIATQQFLDLLDINEYYSTNHGAYVVGKEGELMRWQKLEPATLQGVMKPFLDNPDIEYACIENDVLFVRNPDDERWNWAHTQSRTVKLFDVSRELNAEKVVFTSDALGNEVQTHLDNHYPELITYAWNNNYIEVTSPKSDKGSALALIAEELGIPQNKVIAFGDGPNDTTMLNWAGQGIAVGPYAHTDTLAVANEHIDSPENLGVVSWLEQNLLGKARQAEFSLQ